MHDRLTDEQTDGQENRRLNLNAIFIRVHATLQLDLAVHPLVSWSACWLHFFYVSLLIDITAPVQML